MKPILDYLSSGWVKLDDPVPLDEAFEPDEREGPFKKVLKEVPPFYIRRFVFNSRIACGIVETGYSNFLFVRHPAYGRGWTCRPISGGFVLIDMDEIECCFKTWYPDLPRKPAECHLYPCEEPSRGSAAADAVPPTPPCRPGWFGAGPVEWAAATETSAASAAAASEGSRHDSQIAAAAAVTTTKAASTHRMSRHGAANLNRPEPAESVYVIHRGGRLDSTAGGADATPLRGETQSGLCLPITSALGKFLGSSGGGQ